MKLEEAKEDLGKGVSLEMVLVPAGTFMMGSPANKEGQGNDETQRDVTLTMQYYMKKYEMTQEQGETVKGKNLFPQQPSTALPGSLALALAPKREVAVGTPKCFLVFLVVVLNGLMIGCSNPHNLPLPSDAGLIDWLKGQKVTTAKGVIFDDVWTIESGEVSDFRVISVTKNPSDKIYTVTVSFRAIGKGRGIHVREGVIRYKDVNRSGVNEGKLHFIDFTPVSFVRIGN